MAMDDNPNSTIGEQGRMIDADVAVQLSEQLAAVRDRIVGAFSGEGAEGAGGRSGAGVEIVVSGYRGELTLDVPADRLVEVLAFCRDDEEVRCEILADLSAVHWPGGTQTAKSQETTGWPTFEREQEGRIDVLYLVRSVTHNHLFRVRTSVGDDGPRLPTVEGIWRAAHIMEREVYDFFGVHFEGHSDLRRIEMPDDWVGHPQRKDYPLGGVDVMYKGATVPPPDERRY